MKGPLSIISGRSNIPLAEGIAKFCSTKLTERDIIQFSDSEIYVEIKENVRGRDVFVVQSTSNPGNDHLMEMLIMLDALRRASASRITVVMPYFGYARQDRKVRPRTPITAKLVADLIVSAGANRVLTMDLHTGQIMGFFNIPVDNLYARPVLLKALREKIGSKEVCVVSPDSGGVPRARAYAKRLNAGLAIIDKRRSGPNEVAEMKVVGDVSGKVVVIVDDMVDTGGTLAKAADALIEHGASEVYACSSHAVLSGLAKEVLPKSKIKTIFVSDSIAHPDISNSGSWVEQLSVAPLIGEAILRINREESVSSLFGEHY